MTKLKLFVWTRFCPDYTDGIAFAIAKTEKQAREAVMETHRCATVWEWGNLEVKDLSTTCAYSVIGGGVVRWHIHL